MKDLARTGAKREIETLQAERVYWAQAVGKRDRRIPRRAGFLVTLGLDLSGIAGTGGWDHGEATA